MSRYIVEKFADGAIVFNGSVPSTEFHGEVVIELRAGDTRQVDGVDYNTLDAWLQANPGEAVVEITDGTITAIPLEPDPILKDCPPW